MKTNTSPFKVIIRPFVTNDYENSFKSRNKDRNVYIMNVQL